MKLLDRLELWPGPPVESRSLGRYRYLYHKKDPYV
jgi:hypothetical protein